MKFTFAHNNINVFDLERSLKFYNDALNLTESRRIERDDFTIVYLTDGVTPHLLELTYLKDRTTPYDLGDNEIHIAFRTDDYEGALAKHREMNCICFENKDMGIYFIEDPDGYWCELINAYKTP